MNQGERKGPVDFERLKHLVFTQQLDRGDLVWSPGANAWKPAESIQGLFSEPLRPVATAGRQASAAVPVRKQRETIATFVDFVKSRSRRFWVITGGAAIVSFVLVVILIVASANRQPPSSPPADTTIAGNKETLKSVNKEEAPAGRKKLKHLFAELAPSVPMVEAGMTGGSGFLIVNDRKYLIVTNRHVIDKARDGVEVHFFPSKALGKEEKLVIRRTETKIVAIHRTADLALIDVSSAAGKIEAAPQNS